MKEKDRYVVEKMPTYCLFPEALCGLKDTESKFYVVLENIDAVIKIKDLLNQQDKEIAKLQYRLEVAEKAFELACDPRDDWGGKEYSGTEFNNYHDYFIAEAQKEIAEIGGKDE